MSMSGMGSTMRMAWHGRAEEQAAKSLPLKHAVTESLQVSGSAKAQAQNTAKAAKQAPTWAIDGAEYLLLKAKSIKRRDEVRRFRYEKSNAMS